MKDYKKDFFVWCMIHNRTPNRTDFLGYISNQKMLEKIRKKSQKKTCKKNSI